MNTETNLTPSNTIDNSIGQVVPFNDPYQEPTDLITAQAGGGQEGQMTPNYPLEAESFGAECVTKGCTNASTTVEQGGEKYKSSLCGTCYKDEVWLTCENCGSDDLDAFIDAHGVAVGVCNGCGKRTGGADKNYINPMAGVDDFYRLEAESFSEAGLELRNAGRCGCHQDDVWEVVNVESPVFLCGTCGYAGNKKEDGHFGAVFFGAEQELKRKSCCCGATKSHPCVCMIQGVMKCSATCPCSLAKKGDGPRPIRHTSEDGYVVGQRKTRWFDDWDEAAKRMDILAEGDFKNVWNLVLQYPDGTTMPRRWAVFTDAKDAESFSADYDINLSDPYGNSWKGNLKEKKEAESFSPNEMTKRINECYAKGGHNMKSFKPKGLSAFLPMKKKCIECGATDMMLDMKKQFYPSGPPYPYDAESFNSKVFEAKCRCPGRIGPGWCRWCHGVIEAESTDFQSESFGADSKFKRPYDGRHGFDPKRDTKGRYRRKLVVPLAKGAEGFVYFYTLDEDGFGDHYDTLEEAQAAVAASSKPMEIYERREDIHEPYKMDKRMGAESFGAELRVWSKTPCPTCGQSTNTSKIETVKESAIRIMCGRNACGKPVEEGYWCEGCEGLTHYHCIDQRTSHTRCGHCKGWKMHPYTKDYFMHYTPKEIPEGKVGRCLKCKEWVAGDKDSYMLTCEHCGILLIHTGDGKLKYDAESFESESLVEEPDWIPAGDGRALGQQNLDINLSPLHAEYGVVLDRDMNQEADIPDPIEGDDKEDVREKVEDMMEEEEWGYGEEDLDWEDDGHDGSVIGRIFPMGDYDAEGNLKDYNPITMLVLGIIGGIGIALGAQSLVK